MHVCRFHVPGQGSRLGQVQAGQIYDLTATELPQFGSLTAFLTATTTTSWETLFAELNMDQLPSYTYSDLDCPPDTAVPHLLPAVDRQEVWAAGVTYAWSREARVRETTAKDMYVRVYDAERPELFFKALAEKVVGPNDWIGIRSDSRWNVPEPELALVLNPQLQIVGYTVGNDVSSRDIEGENPLYLPQAKIYRHSCALGPVITLAETTINGQDLTITLTITRAGTVAFEATTSTTNLHRSLTDLARYLGLNNDFPYGAVLLTGTGIVPGDDFTLQDGDDVQIEIGGIGRLHNVVRQM